MGRGGQVFAVGDPFSFKDVPLWDTGDGWDYVAPEGMGCWDESSLVFEVQDDNGDWHEVEPVEVYARTGRVGFSRCYRDRWVRASGVCRPTAFIGWGSEWRMEVDSTAVSAPLLGDGALNQVRVKGVHAVVDGVVAPPIDPVFALLPIGRGVYTGFGALKQTVGGVSIDFNDEGVLYEPR